MVRYYTRQGGKLIELDQPEVSCWVNISPPFSQEELEETAQRFDLPLDFLIDSLDIDERSRYEREGDVRLILLSTPVLSEEEEDKDAIYITAPIGIIITIEHVITVSGHQNPVLRLFLEDRVKNFHPADDMLFVLQLMEQNVYRFLNALKKLNLKRNLIEQELYDSSRNKELKQLLSIEKSLVYFVNALSANELLKMKMKRSDFLHVSGDEDKSDLFEDIIIDNSQALQMANVYTNILNGTMDAYGSIISNNLNHTMRRLTLITVVLMVPTLITSFYGMNVNLPYQEHRLVAYAILAAATVFSIFLAWFFQRKRMY
ncbi:MAG: magnesium transporter CorA family protein [Saprospiraceae bacterium]|nr:magnesium transporter CorA family protein [Saprospiraceae bacterium]